MAYNALQKREACRTKVLQSFQGSDLTPLTAQGLRGEVDPWETLPLNNPPFLPAPVFRYIVDLAFSLVFSCAFLRMSRFTTIREVSCPMTPKDTKMISEGNKIAPE